MWTRSSRCSGGDCVEARPEAGTVLVRDAKKPDRPPLVFSLRTWAEFLDGVADLEL